MAGRKEPHSKVRISGRSATTPARSNTSKLDVHQHIAADRNLQLEICHALEGLADSLPQADLRLAQAIRPIIEPGWNEHIHFQHDVLFPILTRARQPEELKPHLDRLRREHEIISSQQTEVLEQIELLISGEPPNADALGYLLRNVFDTIRRHIESEALLLDACLPATLSKSELGLLEQWASSRTQPPFPISLLPRPATGRQ
jgi:Hemerythrin HHE cation binding domain